MACGKPTNGGHVVEGSPLTCGTKLYWKTDPKRPQDRELEVVLCGECRAKEKSLDTERGIG